MRSRKQRAFFRLHECTQHNTKPHHPYLSPPAEQLRFLGDEVRPTCREFSFGARQVRTGRDNGCAPGLSPFLDTNAGTRMNF